MKNSYGPDKPNADNTYSMVLLLTAIAFGKVDDPAKAAGALLADYNIVDSDDADQFLSNMVLPFDLDAALDNIPMPGQFRDDNGVLDTEGFVHAYIEARSEALNSRARGLGRMQPTEEQRRWAEQLIRNHANGVESPLLSDYLRACEVMGKERALAITGDPVLRHIGQLFPRLEQLQESLRDYVTARVQDNQQQDNQ